MGGDSWQIEIMYPLGLLALIALPVVAYYWRRSLVQFARWQRNASLAVRVLLVLLLTIALCGLQVVTQSDRLFVVFAVDQSESISKASQAAADAFIDKAKEHVADHQAIVLPFAAKPTEDAERDATDIGAALIEAQSRIPAGYVPRIVLLSDGNQTQGDAMAAARAATVPVWTVPLPGRPKNEVYVSAVEAPTRVRQGDLCDVEVTIESTGRNRGRVELLAGDESVAIEPVELVAGENRVSFQYRATAEADVTLTAVVHDFQDTLPENNRLSTVVLVSEQPRVLLVAGPTAHAEPLAAALRQEFVDVERRLPEQVPDTVEQLATYDVVILSNIPATSLSAESMTTLRQYVEQAGGGLITIGGDRAFTAGNYRGTELETVLPVVSEASGKTERPGLAMVLVIDCSGSMKSDDKPAEEQSIALAREAARRAVETLGPPDQVAILAFTEQTRWISPLRHCTDAEKPQILRRIETIEAEGRTDMVPAIEKAYLALHEAYAPLKHMIVLTDGVSHPGDFERLAQDAARSGITISTVALGSEAAAPLLKRMAEIGDGRFYLCDDATAVPRIFATEAAEAARVGIVERPFRPSARDTAEIFGEIDLERMPTLLGYVETKPRPSARVVLASEVGDPLLAWRGVGQGTTVAFTSDTEDRWAAAWLDWPEFGPFWARLVRHAMRKRPENDFVVRAYRRGKHTRVVLDVIDRQGRLLNGAEASIRVEPPGHAAFTSPFTQVAPGRYAVEFRSLVQGTYGLETTLQSTQTQRIAWSVGYADEFRVQRTDDEVLQATAAETGGRFDPSPEQVFAEPGKTVRRTTPLWPYLAALAVLLFVADLILKRADALHKPANSRA